MPVYGIKENKCLAQSVTIQFVDVNFPNGMGLRETREETIDVSELGLTADNYVVAGFAWQTETGGPFRYAPALSKMSSSQNRAFYPIFEVNYQTNQATLALHVINGLLAQNNEPFTVRCVILKYA